MTLNTPPKDHDPALHSNDPSTTGNGAPVFPSSARSGHGRIVTVFGGSGFIGRHVVRAFAHEGYRIRVAVRRPERALFLKTAAHPGDIQCVPADVRTGKNVAACLNGSAIAVNLVGTMFETHRLRFSDIHDTAARHVARAAADAGVRQYIHLSAIGADPRSPSSYARSKAAGEDSVLSEFPEATIVRPSIVFGPEDRFFNLFASLATVSPVLPVFSSVSRFQPVSVCDLAQACVRIAGRCDTPGILEIGGPQVFTMPEMLRLVLSATGRSRILLPVPRPIAHILALISQIFHLHLLTTDQLLLLHRDSLVSDKAIAEGRTLQGIGIQPNGLHALLPFQLRRFRSGTRIPVSSVS